MKRFAVSTLSLAILGGSAAAQAPYGMPVQTPYPAHGMYGAPVPVAPVRVHMGGALTKGGVVPVPFYPQNNTAAPVQDPYAQNPYAPIPYAPSPAGAAQARSFGNVPVHPAILPAPSGSAAPMMTTPLPPGMPPQSPRGAAPARVHMGGALTTGGVMPTSVYLQSNARGSHTIVNMAPGVVPSTHANRQANLPVRQASLNPEAPPAPPVHHDDACADGSCDTPFYPPSMDHARRPNREPHGHQFYTVLEYLHWWTRPQESPPLAQVGASVLTAEDFDDNARHGGRFTLGYWLDSPCPMAIEGVFLFLGEQHEGSTLNSTGSPTLGRPFISAANLQPAVLPIADIGVPGAIAMDTHSRLFGFEVNLRRELCRTAGAHLDFLVGYRQLFLDEGLSVADRTSFADTTIIGVDQFGTHNRVYAGQFGLDGEVSWRRLFVNAWGKFGFGGNRQTVIVNGWTHTITPAGRETVTGDVLTQPSNIGRYRDSAFTVIPEVGVNVGFRVTPNWRVAVGYTVLAIDNVVRPGDQIDPVFSPDGTRPAPPSFSEATYWAHGLNAQMEIRY